MQGGTWNSPVAVKSWPDRANTIGYISGGMAVQAFMLRQVVGLLPAERRDVLHLVSPDEKQISIVCEKLCLNQLAASGLVHRKGETWESADAVKIWIETGDDLILAAHLHANVKFIGELLEAVDANSTHASLLEIANSAYGLVWTSADQVRRRVGWLRSLGFLELWGQKVVRTAKSAELLNGLTLCTPDEIAGTTGAIDFPSLPPIDLAVSGEASQEELRRRKSLIGYIPRGTKSAAHDSGEVKFTPISAIRELIGLMGDGIDLDEFREICNEILGVGKGSFSSMLHALRHMGVIEQTAYNYFVPTVNCRELLQEGAEASFVAYLHLRYTFFGEILKHLEAPTSTTALAAIGRNEYDFSQATNTEVRLRLGFLQDAGFVDRIDWQRFRSTPAGGQFLEQVSLQEGRKIGAFPDEEALPENGNLQALMVRIVDDLRKYGNSGTESREFEVAVAEAFRLLGFRAEHLGGSGRTDVLLTAELAPGDAYRVIVDAKSSGSGNVSDSQVSFDALRDHKKKHSADYIIVVGPNFAGRVKQWAADHGITLFAVDGLNEILARHVVNPIGLAELREVLDRSDLQTEEISDRYQALEQRMDLTLRILQLAFQEANDEDPVAGGFISLENLTYVLRKELTPRPSSEAIQESLAFLCSPIVGALGESKGKYRISDSPRNVAMRLQGLGATLSRAET